LKTNDRVMIVCCEASPYNNQKGVIVRTQLNIDKHKQESTTYIVRLDKPHCAWAKEVGFPIEALRRI